MLLGGNAAVLLSVNGRRSEMCHASDIYVRWCPHVCGSLSANVITYYCSSHAADTAPLKLWRPSRLTQTDFNAAMARHAKSGANHLS